MQSQPRCRPPAAPGPREVGRERRRGRKTLGQPCWAGGKAQPRAHQDGGAELARLPCAGQTRPVSHPAPCSPRGSRGGEAVAGTRARRCLLHPLLTVQVGCPAKEKVSQEAAGAARPHHRGTVPPTFGCGCRAMPPTSRLHRDPPQKGFCGPKKGSVAPSWPEQPGPGRGRVFLPAAAAARAHG